VEALQDERPSLQQQLDAIRSFRRINPNVEVDDERDEDGNTWLMVACRFSRTKIRISLVPFGGTGRLC
jgi:predicted nucleic acid-binding protein